MAAMLLCWGGVASVALVVFAGGPVADSGFGSSGGYWRTGGFDGFFALFQPSIAGAASEPAA
jgi:hypothetical protein